MRHVSCSQIGGRVQLPSFFLKKRIDLCLIAWMSYFFQTSATKIKTGHEVSHVLFHVQVFHVHRHTHSEWLRTGIRGGTCILSASWFSRELVCAPVFPTFHSVVDRVDERNGFSNYACEVDPWMSLTVLPKRRRARRLRPTLRHERATIAMVMAELLFFRAMAPAARTRKEVEKEQDVVEKEQDATAHRGAKVLP